jgi:undecaprenyl-diphosphatase
MSERNGSSHRRLARLRENRALLVLVALFLAFLALCLTARSRWLFNLDHGISLAVQHYRSPLLDLLVEAVSALGNTEALVAAAAIAGIVCWRSGRRKSAYLVAAAVGGLPLNVAIKLWIGRPRPSGDVQVILPALGLSFPSGHSMGSVVVLGALAFLLWVHDPQPRRRRLVTSLLATLPALIGLSRIYLGAHWFSDVIGGWTVGIFFLLLFAEAYKFLATDELEGSRPGAAAPDGA